MSGLTRRDVLRRAGVAGVAVWATPTIVGIGARAAAGTRVSTCTENCGPFNPSSSSSECPQIGTFGCICATDVDGTCQCVQRDVNYNDVTNPNAPEEPICQSDTDCPSDRYCVELNSGFFLAYGGVGCAKICA